MSIRLDLWEIAVAEACERQARRQAISEAEAAVVAAALELCAGWECSARVRLISEVEVLLALRAETPEAE